jgi:hypothetical protein
VKFLMFKIYALNCYLNEKVLSSPTSKLSGTNAKCSALFFYIFLKFGLAVKKI